MSASPTAPAPSASQVSMPQAAGGAGSGDGLAGLGGASQASDSPLLANVVESMLVLQQRMEKMLQLIAEAEEAYRRRNGEMDEIKQRILGSWVHEDDRIKLNIGGKRFETAREHAEKKVFFKNLLTESVVQRDMDGHFFIDADPEWFNVVLNYTHGPVGLHRYTEKQLSLLKETAEDFHMNDFAQEIDRHTTIRRAGGGQVTLKINPRPTAPAAFYGIAFEVDVKSDVVLQGLKFVAGDRRKIDCEVLIKRGNINESNIESAGRDEVNLVKGELIPVPIKPIQMRKGLTTIYVLSRSAATAVAVCKRGESVREYSQLSLGRSYCIGNPSDVRKRSAEDQYDFCGELEISY